ncbi:MAG: acyl-CoA synthetase [Acidimicrobiales bacterium]|nr:acyl-CoA synthetase [Acidimicrobiales bacterium]
MELNLAASHEAVAAKVPDRPCLVWRGRSWTWREVTERTRRLGNLLGDHGIGRHRSLHDCAAWESPHDHVALYLTNSNAYLEGMLGAAKAGAAAFNVNYRYVADELLYLFNDAEAAAIIYHGRFAGALGEVLPKLDTAPRLLLRVDDGTDDELLPGAIDYEEALAASSPARPAVDWLPDDFYVVYTGGTTGNPKGVLWRQADFLVAALGVRQPDGTDFESVEQLVERVSARTLRALPAPPLMHGAAHWNALSAWLSGGTVVIQSVTDRLDPADVLDTCAKEDVTSLLIVGDAFARPLVEEQRRSPRDLTHLRHVLTGGAVLSPSVRAELLELMPNVTVVDVLGSSESGRQAVARSRPGSADNHFEPGENTAIVDDGLEALIPPGDRREGWLAKGGRVPRGYLGDEAKTKETFPVIDGVRWAVAGDRATWGDDGRIELHGRQSGTINTGGEKVFAEEVEQAVKAHPAVYDAIVVGRPDERWGQEVVAVVALRPGGSVTLEEIRSTASAHLAGYKLPRDLVIVEQVQRSPSGKPDYPWARRVATGA